MAYYITSGMNAKALISPAFVETPLNRDARWYELDKLAEILEIELDNLRTEKWRNGKYYLINCTGSKLDQVREIRRELAKIGIEQSEIFHSLNPKYVAYWELDK